MRKANQQSCVCVCFGQTCTDAYRRITVLRYLHLFFLARLSFLSGSNFDAAILCVYVCMCVCLVCHHRLVCDFSHHSPMAPRRSMRRTTAHNNCLCDELYGARCCTKTLVHTVNVFIRVQVGLLSITHTLFHAQFFPMLNSPFLFLFPMISQVDGCSQRWLSYDQEFT